MLCHRKLIVSLVPLLALLRGVRNKAIVPRVVSQPCSSPSANASSQSGNMTSAMESCEVVPDVIDTVPPAVISISYPSGATVDMGNELTPTQVKDEPSHVSWPVDGNSLYTLCMTDPDAPTRHNATLREIKHWLVVNIPGNEIASGTTIAAYRGSGPPLGTGLHRYVFLAYKQTNALDVSSEVFAAANSRAGRRQFRIRDFASKYGLGPPIAGNFYQAQYDDYVPVLQASTDANT